MNKVFSFKNEKENIEINISSKDKEEWKKEEWKNIKEIFSVNYQEDSEDINPLFSIILHFYEKKFKENQKYEFALKPYDDPRPDALLTNEKLDTIGIEIT